MLEYKSIAIQTTQGLTGSKGRIDCEDLDHLLNKMANKGWELDKIEDLEHSAGTMCLLCVFKRDSSLPKPPKLGNHNNDT